MAIQTEPTRIQIPFADSGTKNVIPDTNSTPSASQAASWTDGFPSQCSLPLSAGGIPPARADFNGIFNTMSQSIRFGQEGGVWAWDATVDYAANRVVLGSDGTLYWSVAQSGPNVGGAQDPVADTSFTYWVPNQFPKDLYVDAVNGDDSNDGFSAATAKKTYAAVKTVIQNRYANYGNRLITVHFASGTYNETITPVPSTIIEAQGSVGATIVGVDCYDFNRISIGGSFNITGRVVCSSNSFLFVGGSLSFSGVSTDVAFQASLAATLVLWTTASVSFSSCTYSSATIVSQTGGIVNCRCSFSGSVSGKRYSVGALSGIFSTGSTTKIPGSINGTVDSLGYYN